MIDNSKNTKLNLAFTSKNGTKFYCLVNPLEISALRGLAAEKAKRFADMNITERSLRALVNEANEAASKNDLMLAFSCMQEIKYRLDFLSEENSILDLSCIYFFLEDEDIDEPSEAHNKKKHAIFESDITAKVFFLKIGLSIVKRYSEKQEQDILNYLEENQILSERIRRYISVESELNSIRG